MQPTEAELRAAAEVRATIDREVTARYAPEDDVLRHANERAQHEGMPAIQISPLQGRLLQVLALSCGAHKILEIGALAGYSGTWLARALPADGRMITLEVSPKHAEVARATYTEAGVADRIDIRVGPALEILPQLTGEAPFDLVFIDADKGNYPAYLDWAIRLSRPGTVIVADNLIRGGKVFQSPPLAPDLPADADNAGLAEYTARATSDPRLLSVAFPMDDDGTDGFAISVVRAIS